MLELHKISANNLKEALKLLGCRTTNGTKAELLERLEHWVASEPATGLSLTEGRVISQKDINRVDTADTRHKEIMKALDQLTLTPNDITPDDIRNSMSVTEVKAPESEEVTCTRDDIRDAARMLLTTQPDGRARALKVLNRFGGSVSKVPENSLDECLTALENEKYALTTN